MLNWKNANWTNINNLNKTEACSENYKTGRKKYHEKKEEKKESAWSSETVPTFSLFSSGALLHT